MSTLQGKLRQKSKSGQYYYRLTIAQGNRKEFSLGTSDLDEACRKAEELDSIWLAPYYWSPGPEWETIGYVAGGAALVGLGALLYHWLKD